MITWNINEFSVFCQSYQFGYHRSISAVQADAFETSDRIEVCRNDPLIKEVAKDHHFFYRRVNQLLSEKLCQKRSVVTKPNIWVLTWIALFIAHVDIAYKDSFGSVCHGFGTLLFDQLQKTAHP